MGQKLERAGGLGLRHAVIALFAVMTTLAPTLAAASTGCAAVNAGALDSSTTFAGTAITSTNARESTTTLAFNGVNVGLTNATALRWYPGGPHAFAVGDVINMTISTDNPVAMFQRATSAGGAFVNIGTTSGSYQYTVTASEFAFQTRAAQNNTNGTSSFVATCTPAPPTISNLTPTAGPTAGGTSVTLTGENFLGATVTVDGATVTPTTLTDTTIVLTTPAHAAGLVAIAVATAGGSTSSNFTYVAPPTVTSISPTAGPTTGGTTVIITGTNFSGATAVTFGGTAATGFTVDSATQITATAPAGSGTVDVRVTTVGGTSATSAADQFTYVPAPAVTSISPTAGPTTGGTTVTITGTNLSGATAVTFGGTAATGFTVDSATQITATAPAGSGTVDVRVTTVGGTSATSAADQFTYVPAPTVTSISPTAGPTGGGTTVTITGTNLSGATAVTFGGTAATGFTVVNGTTISATAPAGAVGTVDVRVTAIGGTSATSAADQFTYVAAPTVTSISPTAGPTGGGTTVIITGTGFSAASPTGAVKFGATNATYTINSNTQITATSPANAAGTYDVTVTTVGGTSATSAADQFTYVAAPTVTSISPTAGPTTGGTTVTITGTNLSGATAVTFGATAATGFTVDSATQITATAPANSAGTYDIRVTTVGGTSATSAADQYTYVSAPTVTAVSPTAGPTGGGTTVIITGTGFAAASPTGAVKFGATNATYTINSNTQITATSPANAAGAYDVTVTTVGGTSATSAADQFTYVAAPTVTSVSPTAGPTSGGTTVIITGTNLSGATAVTFGATAATGFTVDSATQITATSPANAAGTYDIRVTTVGGTSATSASDQFTYVPAPTVTSISPTAGPTVGGTTVTITGTNLAGATAVTFGGSAATGFTVNSNTQITATAPANAAGTYDIRVTTVGGTSATSAADQFTYVAAPTVTSISPTAGPIGGGTTVIITGTGLSGATAVTFGGTAATGYTVNSGSQITATAPAGAVGTVDVRVTTIGGTSATSASDQYTYVAAPTGSSFTFSGTAIYNTGANTTASIDVATEGSVQNSPTSYAVGSATTAQGGGVTINSSGQATYTPPVGYRGSDSFTYTATNVGGTSAPATVTVNVGDPTFSATLTAPTATVGVAYTGGVTISGGRAAYTVNSISGLPPGLTDQGGGAFSGTPTSDGSYSITFNVTDSSLGSPYTSTASATLTIGLPPPPVVASIGAPAVAYNATGATFSVTGTNNPTGYAVGSATTANGGSVSVSSAGLVTYNAPTGFRGNDSFTYTATNQGGTSSPATVTVPVSNPTFTITLPSATGVVGDAYNAAGTPVTVTGGQAPYSGFSATGLPAGLSMNSSGVISGTPTLEANTTVVVTLTDSSAGTGPFTSTASAPLEILAPTLVINPVSTTLPAATQHSAYNVTLTTTGGTAPYQYTTASTLPNGVSLAANGSLSGTPTQTGTFSVDVRSTDASVGGPYFVDKTYTLVVNPPAPPTPADVSVTVAANSTGNVINASLSGVPATGVTASTPAHGTITATSTTAPFTFTYEPTPGFSGTDTFTYTASNAGGTSAAATVTVTVTPPTLVVTGAPGNGTVGVLYTNATFTASTGTAPYTFGGTSVPPGLVLNTAGVLSGVPSAGGSFNMVVTATDAYGATGSATFPITIASPTLSLAPTSLPVGDYGVAYSQTFQASGGYPTYTYTATGALPTGVTLNASTGELSGTPTEAGSFPLTVTATDSATGSGPYQVSVNVTLTINQAAVPVVEPTNTSTPSGSPTTIDVSSLIDGFYDSVIITTPPQHGTAVVNGSASRMRSQSGPSVTITYTPNPGYFGPDSFSYAASGPGGTSSPAAISVAVAAPAPVVVDDTATTNANAAVVIAVTTNDTGPLDTIAVATQPANGTATVSGLNVNYVPAQNFFGTDTFTYTATGPGGTGGPATVTVTVNPLAVPTQSAQTLTVLAGQSVTLAATQGATGSPFTGVAVATAPTKGVAVVNGETIVYTPATGFSGSDSFTYRINNPFGASTPVPVTVTVNPAPLTAPPITVEILAGQKAVVNLVSGASGGPFIGAAVASITPANSGAAVVTNPSSGAYTLTYTPDNAFAGTAVVTYTLSNAFATSAPGRINVIVKARPDPSQDPEVKGLIAAQDAAAVRFADAQISNFNRRLEQLHNGGGAGRGFGVSVSGGDAEREDGLEARERFRKYASLGMNDAADPSSPLLPEPSAGYTAKDDGEDGQAGPKRWGVWAAGSADFGMRDAVGSQSGFRFTTDGLTGGVDYRVNPDFAFGLGVGYGRDSSRVGKSGTKSRAESYSAGLYASLKTGEKTFLDGVLGYGTLDFDTRRYVTSTGELVNGERNGDQVFGALTFGMEHRTQTSLLSPYGRVAYSRSQLDAFSENGGGPYGLTYHAQTVKSLTGTLGLRGEFLRKTAAGLLAPRFRVEYSHDFEKTGDALLNYTDWVGGPTYRLTVDPIDRDQLRLELGADLTIKNGIRLGLDFDNMVTKDSDSQGVRLSIQSPF
ncbi:hypothetical protein CFHF_15635 [Caulobacter flavus]|uniref:Autotransporter domain-containing protein n=1 Tax=Caulobacter flavus TaxID=1679497 RepID=A0A2N5CRL7_9CAUL|nr:IPT/TIG domain-containing protein [Caulobacter flavus]AYV46331.1 hypothetical protein C1707_08715 [Caulobacter flavus]PLR12000.1 hypothetical protein CFHF_15635 [Caulobacter flavus]